MKFSAFFQKLATLLFQIRFWCSWCRSTPQDKLSNFAIDNFFRKPFCTPEKYEKLKIVWFSIVVFGPFRSWDFICHRILLHGNLIFGLPQQLAIEFEQTRKILAFIFRFFGANFVKKRNFCCFQAKNVYISAKIVPILCKSNVYVHAHRFG